MTESSPHAVLDAQRETLAGRETACGDTIRARAAAVALEQECAVLSDTLAKLTHEFEPYTSHSSHCRVCTWRVDDPRHRTPAWLRARYQLGA